MITVKRNGCSSEFRRSCCSLSSKCRSGAVCSSPSAISWELPLFNTVKREFDSLSFFFEGEAARGPEKSYNLGRTPRSHAPQGPTINCTFDLIFYSLEYRCISRSLREVFEATVIIHQVYLIMEDHRIQLDEDLQSVSSLSSDTLSISIFYVSFAIEIYFVSFGLIVIPEDLFDLCTAWIGYIQHGLVSPC